MALPLFRGCPRLSSAFSLTRLCINKDSTLSMSRKSRFLISSSAVRPYSSQSEKNKHKIIIVDYSNPLLWARSRLCMFLIWTYFDNDFCMQEFIEGATQAFSHVSRLLSQCQFEALEGLVAKDLIGRLEEKCDVLPIVRKRALSAEFDDIIYTSAGDVRISFGNNGRKFVRIVMMFCYLTSERIPGDINNEVVIIPKVAGRRRMLTALYEFQSEFTPGVPPDWTITGIRHSTLLD